MFKLLRHFTVRSALATAAITTVLVMAFYWLEVRNLDHLVQDRNAAQAHSFANALLPRYADHLAQSAPVTGDLLRAQPATWLLDAEARQSTRGLPILKVKIYNASGLTIYSSDPSEIGESSSEDARLRQAFATGKVSSTSSYREVLGAIGAASGERPVSETLVPIRDEAGIVSAAIELHTDITTYVRELWRGLATVAAMLVAALGTLFIVLLLVVRRADGILLRQYGELEAYRAHLEEKVDERTRRLLNQQSVLSWLIKSEDLRCGDLDVAIGNLTRVAAATLGVARVGVWMLHSERGELHCIGLYCTPRGEHTRGQSLCISRYPKYFGALQVHETLSIDDAQQDERLAELREDHLEPLKIGSRLDVPIVHTGRIEGVLCIEHVGTPIKWSPEQRMFAFAIANFASLAVERQERLKVEEDLRAANRSVEAANKAKSLFLANMSHEIRTPMNGVFGMTDLLMRTELSDRQRKFVGIISSSAKRLLTIINDILDLSRIESGKLELDRHDFALRSSLEETIDLLAAEAERKGLELSLVVARDVPAVVAGNSGRLRQVLTNLVSNAIKFTNGGEVIVRISRVGEREGVASLAFEVRDTGIGIPADIQERLFTPFQQADTSISRRFGGTGLGLSISRHLVELMGGKIELSSAAGKGTAIWFVLEMPVKEADAAERDEAEEATALANRRVLVLDDRATNREVIVSYFSDCGVNASGVATAREAYDELVRRSAAGDPVAIVVVDMLMPDVNGLEFAQMVRANPRLAATKLIMLTSLSWKGDVRVARELGFGAFLTKPVHRNQIIRVAQQLISLDKAGGETGSQRAASAADPAIGQHAGNPATRSIAGLRVLIAEDNPVNVEVAREYLTGMGCQVSTAENGREAYEAVGSGRFDIVLMDCQMPEMDGLTATRLIRQLEGESTVRHTIIIAVTANAFAEDRAMCMEAGMDDYMSKPFSEAQLRELLERWAPKSIPAAAAAAGGPSLGSAAVPVSPVAIAGALDLEMLRRMQRSHPTLAARLVDTYLGYAPKAIQQLLAAMAAEDITQLRTTAHSLKSSSANIGAAYLSGLCRTLEARLKTATTWDAAENLAVVAEIESAFQAVAAALDALQAELKAAVPAGKASA